MKYIVLTIAILLTSTAHAQNGHHDNKKVKQLLELINALEMTSQMYPQIVQTLKPVFPKVPDNIWKEFGKSLETEKFEELMITLYIDSYTPDEVDAMIKFYSTPVGQSILIKTPGIFQKSMQVGMAWGQQQAGIIAQKLKDKGYKPVAI